MSEERTGDIRSYPIHSTPCARPWKIWVQLWWSWCYGNSLGSSPASDSTGALCGKNQNHENVWFLAGTFGGRVQRKCVIPSQTSIFFPILNDIVSFATDPHLKTEEELIIYAKADLDSTRSLFAVVDEREVADLWDFRVRTSIFDLELPVTKGSKKHVKTKAVSDGYWLFLAPLTKGDHTIYFSGEKLDFDKVRTFNSAKLPIFRVEVKYELTIKE